MGRRTPGEGNPPGKHTFFKCILTKHIVGLQTTFFDSFNVLMSFLAEMMQNDLEISSKHKF